MGKSLVIVESPAKAKTINKYLGRDFIVKSSIGHIRDLPTSGRKKETINKTPTRPSKKLSEEARLAEKKQKALSQLVNRMGINPEKNWEAQYEILPGKEKVVNELKKLAKDADTVYLATDLDREGEAIAWHLQQAIGPKAANYKRVVFNEITKSAIENAFVDPGELDINRVNAQQARRFLDRVVGYMVSPLLWKKIARGLSAGRVQSVAVRLIVEREKAIRAFNPEEYWELYADLLTSSQTVNFQVHKHQNQPFKPSNKAAIDKALAELKTSSYEVKSKDERPTKTNPSAPFITSTLQQSASTRLHFSVKKTMTLAQRLYEAGLITYMRTDSTNLSKEAVSHCRDYISANFAKGYLPESAIFYANKKGSQEAHEAIRPSDVNLTPNSIHSLERDAQRLYDLIWRQFVACQMASARYLSTSVTVKAGDYELKAKGRQILFDGFTKVQKALIKKGEETLLPNMSTGEQLSLQKLNPKQLFTKPPARFSEASLVKELEKQGIGRPSTYASIISTIQDRGYVTSDNRRFYAEKMGDIVTHRLVECFDDLMDYNFTAKMEAYLDEVATGSRNWKKLLDLFYSEFSENLSKAEAMEGGMRANEPTLTDIQCPSCGKNMQIRTASTGVFLGCSGYNLPPKERCKTTINLIQAPHSIKKPNSDTNESELSELRAKRRCSICQAAMDLYSLDENRQLHICGNNPDCPGYEIEKGTFATKAYDGPTLECDKCGEEMRFKTGRFGKYFGCSNENCKNTRKLLKSGQPAPPKMDPVPMPELQCKKVQDTYILRDGAAGLFLAASKFPTNRETRAPLLMELLPHKDEIDPKYYYLLTGPTEDKEENPSVVRFSRKTSEQYLMTEKDGKATGWTAHYKDGKWQTNQTKKRKKS